MKEMGIPCRRADPGPLLGGILSMFSRGDPPLQWDPAPRVAPSVRGEALPGSLHGIPLPGGIPTLGGSHPLGGMPSVPSRSHSLVGSHSHVESPLFLRDPIPRWDLLHDP